MALGFYSLYNLQYNHLLPANLVDNKLVNAFLEAFTKNNKFLISIFYISIFKLIFDIIPSFAINFILILILVVSNTDFDLFKQFIKAYLEAQAQLLVLFPTQIPTQIEFW